MSEQRARASDEARGFPAFPALKGRGAKGGGRTWWGRAWVGAVEETALDAEPLRKGRAYARTGHVGTITVSPGRIAAPVHDAGGSYRTVVYVTPLTDAEWDRFLAQVAAKAGHIAALLDRDVPHDLVSSAEDAGVRLLPGSDDLEPECDCPDWEFPCRHAAALCYQTAWLLDEDPFLLLLMRGRAEHALLDELRRRGAGGVPGPEAERRGEGVPAARAYAEEPRPLPDPGPLPPGGAPPELPDAPGVDAGALRLLAADAAARAGELLRGRTPPSLTVWQDTVRLAASHPEGRIRARLEQACGRPGGLERAVRAWRQGGAVGLDVLERPWSPPRVEMARARSALAEVWEGGAPPEARLWRNRWTLAGQGVQLRRGTDGRWYPYRRESGDWWPAGSPGTDPAAVLGALLDG
ncbi:SWIM zinc finger family protein [Actinorugispora endophytica]|uniref:Putative Zn finger protein n=1 Tax=Actinorugispora endophytica TaxID=1605990 RepID=A0A4R6UJN3_9ACTN|nr:SWIM zinc finger family protein [Actinorugispora endophytica]TDQ46326.1 putative Zn finger protein [Actinorugispora endophytica]